MLFFIIPSKRLLTTTLALAMFPSMVFAESDIADIEHVEITNVRLPFRGDIPLTSQPQAVDMVSAEQMSSLGITDFSSALSLSAAVNKQNNFGGVWSSFAVRGFVGDENVPSGYLVNGFNAGRGFGGTRDMTNVKRVEILKGPGSALYGRSEPGGTVNIITKKPQFEQQGYVQASAGKWDQYRVEGDYTGAANNDLAFRINGAYENNGSFRVPIDSEKVALTPSLLWLVNDDTRVSYEMEYLDQALPFDRGIVALDNNPEALPVDRFLGEPADGPNQVDVLGHQLTLEHDFTDWSLLTGLSYRDTELSGFSSDPELVPSRQLLFIDGETLSRQHSYRDFSTSDFSARIEGSGKIDIAGIRHHILMGADYYHFTFNKYWLRYRPSPGEDSYAINIFDPDYGQVSPPMPLLYDQTEEQDNYGIYVQDQMDVTKRLKLLLGGRFDDFDQTIVNHIKDSEVSQNQTVFSPRAGMVYDLTQSMSLYASYSKGFRPNTGANVQGEAFSPEKSRSYEVGTKFQVDNMEGTVALFQAQKSNILTADPVNSGFSAALGEAKSKGVELDFTGYIGDNFRAGISYAYTEAETENDVINADWGVNIPKGSRLINVPKHKGVLNIGYDLALFDRASTVGGNIQFVGKRLGETIDPSYELPEYTLVNLYARVSIATNTTLQFNVFNLFDEVYYPSSYSALWTAPGTPRSYRVSLRYNF